MTATKKIRKTAKIGLISLAALYATAGLGLAQTNAYNGFYIFPNDGTNKTYDEQQLDQSQCNDSAVQMSGYDPAYQDYAAQDAGKNKVKKNTAIGAAGGAAGGAVLGEVIGDKAGWGALAGGAVGGYLGHKKGKKSKSEAQSYAQGHREEYNKAFTACMNARGYSVQ